MIFLFIIFELALLCNSFNFRKFSLTKTTGVSSVELPFYLARQIEVADQLKLLEKSLTSKGLPKS